MSAKPLLEPVQAIEDLESIRSALNKLLDWRAHPDGFKAMVRHGVPNQVDSDSFALPPRAWDAIAELLGLMAQQQPVLLMPLGVPDVANNLGGSIAVENEEKCSASNGRDLERPDANAVVHGDLALMARLILADTESAKIAQRIYREFRGTS